MKNISIILNAILLVAVGVLYILHFTSKNHSSVQNPIQESQSIKLTEGQLPIAYVYMDSLQLNYTLFKESKEIFEGKKKNMETDLSSRSKSYEERVAGFQDKVQKQLITRRQAEEMNQQLMEEQQNLLQLKDQMSMQLMEHEQSLNRQIFDSINSFLRDYNKDKRYQIILGTTLGGGLLQGNEHMNLTKIVIEGINKRYEGKAKENKTTKTGKQ